MKRTGFLYQDEGITPVVSTILLLVITLTIIGGIIVWALPTLLNQESDAKFEASYNNLEVLATGMEDSVYSGEDSSRTINFDLAGGNMHIRQDLERWTISYSYIDTSLNLTSFSPKSTLFSYDFYNRGSEHNVVKIKNLENGNITILETDNDTIVMEEKLFQYPSHILIFNGTTTNLSELLGEVWLFYVDGIAYSQATGKGQYNILVLNGGIITDPDSKYGYVARDPMVTVEENSILLYILQMNGTGLTGGGSGKYKASVAVDEVNVRKVGEVKYLRLQIDGDKYKQAWYNSFFISELGFEAGPRDENRIPRYIEFSPIGYDNTAGLKLVQVYQSVKLEAR